MCDRDVHILKLAARLAIRGHGGAEPNPMVGALIIRRAGEVVGWGYHRRCGAPHAEVIALQRAGERARGATLYCTLEPCDHTGRTPPCTQAIINAGIARVVIARRDPNLIAAGGMARLKAAGIEVAVNDRCEQAIMVSDPFVYRVRSGLPWVIAKWAQTIDGKIATSSGESQWISSERSRQMVHRERGRIDAILTGIGTVLKDDPQLTARGVRIRRIAKRVVIDPLLQTPPKSKLVTSAREVPTIIACGEVAMQRDPALVEHFCSCGVDLLPVPMIGEQMRIGCVLRELAARYEITNLLVEAGPGLLSCLFQQRLVNEAWVFTAPMLLGDEHAKHAVSGMNVKRLLDGTRLRLLNMRRRGDDIVARYRVLQSYIT